MTIDGHELAGLLVDEVRAHVTNELAETVAKLADCEQRLKDLEDAKVNTMRFAGTFNRANVYRRGDTVVHNGNLFFCTRETTGAQIAGNDAFVLVTKRVEGR